jgi:carboxyl-terminal processing protease
MRATRPLLLGLLVLAAAACELQQYPTGSGELSERTNIAFVEEFIARAEAFSIRRDSINWPSVRANVKAMLAGTTEIEQTHGAIAYVLQTLGDNHSYVRDVRGRDVLYPRSILCSTAAPEPVRGRPDDIGYVRVGPYTGSILSSQDYTSAVQAAMAAADADSLAGWVVDLRGNTGGNVWPMLTTVWPFVQGDVVYFVDSDNVQTPVTVQLWRSFVDGEFAAQAHLPYTPRGENHRVAVLTDVSVTAAGEVLAIAFRGRPNTRSFGAATCGLTTALEFHQITPHSTGNPNDPAYVFALASARLMDRTGVAYGGQVPVDESISDPDSVLAAAYAWLRAGPP